MIFHCVYQTFLKAPVHPIIQSYCFEATLKEFTCIYLKFHKLVSTFHLQDLDSKLRIPLPGTRV